MPEPRKIAILFLNFGPYHVARLQAAERLGEAKGFEVVGLEIAGTMQIYPWLRDAGSLKRHYTILPQAVWENVSVSQIVKRTWQKLTQIKPDILAICGYSDPAMLTALAWSSFYRKCAILMSDSKIDDQPRQPWKEWLKRQLVSRFHGALVAGTPQRRYAVRLGLPPARVFLGYDVVDNDYFARGAAAARREKERCRSLLGLPRPFFLSVGRFVEKKNLFRLLAAYRLYREASLPEPWDLVLCGSGPLEAKLQAAARELPGVHFPGFKQAEELPAYYGLAGVFIMPSSHFEQWGLVVNEAMAAGLPVLVSRACGCAQDLVQEGVNGFTFDPFEVEGLTRLMVKMASGEVDLESMGEASQRIIAAWTPEVFAENLFKAIAAPAAARQAGK
jgi:glycosyltransferase involved in cell wall biosynthesis